MPRAIIQLALKKSAYEPSGPYAVSLSMKRLGASLLSPDGILVHRRVTSTKSSGTHLNIWAERGTVGVKCLAQEQSTKFLARA